MESQPARIYLIRHAQTALNAIGRRQGRQDYPLTQEGLELTEKLADSLQHIPFTKFFSSSLVRAQDTANMIRKFHPEAAHEIDDRLIERSFGKYEVPGHTSEFNEKMVRLKELGSDIRFNYKIAPDIESDAELVERFEHFLFEKAVNGDTLCIVSHAGVFRALLIKLGFARWKELPSGAISNLAYAVLEMNAGEISVVDTVGIKKFAID